MLLSIIAQPARAEESNLQLGASYVTDVLANVDGGKRSGAVWLGRADVTAELDGGIVGLDGTRAFVDLMYTHGSDFSGTKVGDAQVVSNIDADRALRVLEAWALVPMGADGLTAKVGFIDLNTEFDVQEVGSFFLNSSHGIGPEFSQSGLNGPSIFPVTSTGMVLRWERTGWDVRAGLFDALAGTEADPSQPALRLPGRKGALLAIEADVSIATTARLQLGLWTYTAGTYPQQASRINRGIYAMVEGRLAGQEGSPRLDGWIRTGFADADADAIRFYLGGGLTYGTEESKIGIAVAMARLGHSINRIDVDTAETSIELSYSRALNDWLTIQPDVQYVINPGWNAAHRNALVLGARFMFEL